MNLGNPFLIKCLMILFSLEGSVSMNDKIHSHIGDQIILLAPIPSATRKKLIWKKDFTAIAYFPNDNKIPNPNKYNLFLNGSLKINNLKKIDAGNYTVEAYDNHDHKLFDKLITLQVDDLFDYRPMLFILLISTGSVVTLIIVLALIIYCIRRKKAKRCEREAQEYALQIQIQNHMQQRKLPEIPVSSGCTPPSQKSRSSPSELPQKFAPSKSCPHPKPPRRTKERL